MKKNFLTVAAMAVVAFFVSTEIAKAADITFSGQIRTRMELNEHLGGGTATASGVGTANNNSFLADNTDEFTFSSVRLAADAKINDTTSAFIQMQSVRNWGNTSNTSNTATGAGAGSGNSSFSANNVDASVGIHQAYFTLKNFLTLPVPMDMKLGRQEIKLDGWRLFGNTIWTPGMQTHDAVTFHHQHDNMKVTAGYLKTRENSRVGELDDNQDGQVYLVHANFKGVLGGQFSAIYSYLDEGCSPATANSAGGTRDCQIGENNFHTMGGRQAGQMFGLDYRGEFYYQFGRADGVANNGAAGTPEVDRSAYMFGVRVGKKFNNVMYKPSVTLWYDYLSGTTDEDQADGDWSSFNTLFDTGHKFYGLQDVFLGIGNGGVAGTRGLGLQDLAVKFKMNPMPGWTLKFDAHAFATAEGICANTTTSNVTCKAAGAVAGTAGGASQNQAHYETWLGNELDLTLVNKYNDNTKIMIGWSNFNAGAGMKKLKDNGGGLIGSSDANWAYLQFDVQF